MDDTTVVEERWCGVVMVLEYALAKSDRDAEASWGGGVMVCARDPCARRLCFLSRRDKHPTTLAADKYSLLRQPS